MLLKFEEPIHLSRRSDFQNTSWKRQELNSEIKSLLRSRERKRLQVKDMYTLFDTLLEKSHTLDLHNSFSDLAINNFPSFLYFSFHVRCIK